MGELLPFKREPKCSYIFSVSIATGCYRHIRVDGRDTLEMLSAYILEAFDFDNDHAHAFFMDNKAWSDMDCYFVDNGSDECRNTCDYRLMDLKVITLVKMPSMGSFPMRMTNNWFPCGSKPLEVGHKFKYIFDFGDDWRFDCKVLKILEEETEVAHIVRSKGQPPTQYGSDDPFDDYDEIDDLDE
ncbi:hypothetical protein RFF05_04330 [Bengtsoniella intestinalis]|uniref:hypothetical protein n=1 Tax=Bengtsoniella intestinalis TaxID=3073143 RepID=UPI00391F919C